MSLEIDADGTISLYQGDSGEITVSGIDGTKNYVLYFSIQDKKRKLIGNELQVIANKTPFVTFILTADYTDLLKVPVNKPYEIYTYGIKACDLSVGGEDTLFVKGSNFGDSNRVIVYPRKVMAV